MKNTKDRTSSDHCKREANNMILKKLALVRTCSDKIIANKSTNTYVAREDSNSIGF